MHVRPLILVSLIAGALWAPAVRAAPPPLSPQPPVNLPRGPRHTPKSPPAPPRGPAELPATGGATVPVGLGGAILLLGGVAVRRRTVAGG